MNNNNNKINFTFFDSWQKYPVYMDENSCGSTGLDQPAKTIIYEKQSIEILLKQGIFTAYSRSL